MRSALTSVAALLIAVVFLVAGYGLLLTLLPLRAQIEGMSAFAIGLMGSAYFLGMMVGCLASPLFIREVGHIRAFATGAALLTVVPLAHAMVIDPWVWIVLRIASGFSIALLYSVIESWLNEKAPNAYRGQILAIYNIVNYAATAVGQQAMRLYAPKGFELFSIAAILVSLAAIPVAMTRAAAPPVPTSPKLRILWLYRLSPVGVIGSFGTGLANGAFWSLAPTYVVDSGLSPAGVANFFAAAMLGVTISLWPLGRLSDRIDRRIVLVMATSAAAVVGAGIVTTRLMGYEQEWMLYSLAFLFGFAALPSYSLASAHANDFAEPGDLVEVSTALLLIFTFGAIIGPLAASALMGAFGSMALFGYTAVIHLAMTLLTLRRMRMRVAKPPSERERFVTAPSTSPTVVGLNPRVSSTRDAGKPDGGGRGSPSVS